jgi:hypothetical protein
MHACLENDVTFVDCLQVDLAAIATDNELRTQAQLQAITKRDVDPVKAVTTMAAVLGGKYFLLQVRSRTLQQPFNLFRSSNVCAAHPPSRR